MLTRSKKINFFINVALLCCAASYVQALETDGFAALDGRFFIHDAAVPAQQHDHPFSLVLEPEWVVPIGERQHVTLRPFARYDAADDRRSHLDIREALWQFEYDRHSLSAGIGKVFWGVAESKHLVDIINQDDAVERPDSEAKLGQPMLSYRYQSDWGTAEFYHLPWFRERRFAGNAGRLRSVPAVDQQTPLYDSGARAARHDGAVRYSHVLGDWDVGLAHFSGTSREPQFVVAGGKVTPRYAVIDQSSVDVQWTRDAWLLKWEAFSRQGHGDRFEASTQGLEYTFFDVGAWSWDVGLLAEYHYENRGAGAPPTLLADDVFVGARLVLNNVADTQLLAGVVKDRRADTRLYQAEFSHRVNDDWKLEINGRWFDDLPTVPLFAGLERDDHVEVRLARYF